MNFVNTKYLPYIIGGILFLAILLAYLNGKYFTWVKTFWFFERSWISRFSSGIYILSIGLMLTALLDLRGPEQRVKSSLPDQRTIIILDSSSSMLSEDVRPNRFGKAIQLARHFVKNAAGHQVSIVLFSDTQKRIMPFTDDIDLLDSRLAALEKTNSVGGGSNISQAIAEGAGYFESDDENSGAGNILVFTDAEESEDGFKLELGNNLNLAVVGIGTAKGGNIPIRWEDGSFKGYKTQKGEPVTTRLDENYIKKLGSDVKNYKYWIANSYSLPTEEIMGFFRGNYNKTHGQGDVRVRPVLSHMILIPAIILYCLSVALGRFASFRNIVSIAALIFFSLVGGRADAQDTEEPPPKERPVALKKDIEKMKSGKSDRREVLKVAEKLLKNDENEKASELYAEYGKPDDEQAVLFNRSTALLKNGKIDEALPFIQQILKNSRDETLKDRMRNNLLLAMKQEQEKKNQDKKDDKNKDEKKDDKKEKNEDKEGKGKDEQGQEDKDKKDPSDEKDKKDGKNSKESKEQKQNKKGHGKDKEEIEDDKNKEKKEPKDLDKPEREDIGPKTLEEKEKMIEQKRKMVKTPAMVKQILNDDRELQKRLMDTSTKSGTNKPKRDW